MNHPRDLPAPSIEPDDPRISEWIDGRLPAAEAAAVERAVGGSPALTRLVADLRAVKAATRRAATARPPAGFTDRVMAAVAAGEASSERVVDREWRVIEAERLAAERTEAAADRVEATREPARGPWPWLALAGALAAGLVLAVAVDRGREAGREVALAPPAGVPADSEADRISSPARGRQGDGASMRPRPAEPVAASPPAAPSAANRTLAKNLSATRADLDDEALRAVAGPEPIEVVVAGAEGRAALIRSLAEMGLQVTPLEEAARKREGPGAGPGPGILEVTGPAAAIEAVALDLRRDRDLRRSLQGEGGGGGNGLAIGSGEPSGVLQDRARAATEAADQKGRGLDALARTKPAEARAATPAAEASADKAADEKEALGEAETSVQPSALLVIRIVELAEPTADGDPPHP